jgi:nitrous oxidase accessory protein NosD
MTDSIARNNHVINAQTGVLLSESPNNQVYDNVIEGAEGEGIRLLNPAIADDGSTTGNIIYNNNISSETVLGQQIAKIISCKILHFQI